MLKCLFFGLFVLFILFLVPQGAKIFHSSKTLSRYKASLFTICISGILWLTLINRWGLEVSNIRFKPFYVLRLILNCQFGWKKMSSNTCNAIMRNSNHLFNSAQATPIEDLLLNIILFVPLGFLLPYLWPKLNGWKTICISGLFSVFIETTQYIAQLGCCDIDDIINNTLGAWIGYLIYRIYIKLNISK